VLIRISDPTLLLELRSYLVQRADCVATAVGPDALDVTILGSYNTEAMDMETQLRVRAWEEGQLARGVDVRVCWTD
jgi:hypothetical protein